MIWNTVNILCVVDCWVQYEYSIGMRHSHFFPQMSVLETLYSGDTVLLVFPDGTGPALLSCLIAGIPLDKVHELQYQPGEIRFDVNYDSINVLASSLQPPSQTYLDKLQRGRDELKQLRENPDLLRNVKELEYERELEQENREREAKKEEEAQAIQLERRKENETAEREKKEREAKRTEEMRAVTAREVEQRRKREERRRVVQLKKKEEDTNQNSIDGSDGSTSFDVGRMGIFGTVVAGVAIVSSNLVGGDEAQDVVVVNEGANQTIIGIEEESSFNSTVPVIDPEDDVTKNLLGVNNETTVEMIDEGNDKMEINSDSLLNATTPAITSEIEKDDATTSIDDSLESEIESLPDGAPEGMLNGPDNSSWDDQTQQSDKEYDWDDDWLGSISEIMNEDTED